MGSGTAGRIRPVVVVVGLDCITGLQTARLFRARGIRVIGLAADPGHFCARTNAVSRVVRAPLSGEGLIVALERLAPELPTPGFAVLMPCTDAAVLAISEWRDRLAAAYRFVMPDHDVLELLVDKVRFAEHAIADGLAFPETAILRDRDAAVRAATTLSFPAVVKPPIKTARWFAGTSLKAIRVATPDELLETYDRASTWADVLIAQSWIDGDESALYSCNAYFDRAGEPVATFIARKIRQWPPDTGTSSLGVEVRDDAVLEESIRLFRSVGYRGLAYLEVKRDAATGRLAIIEPNLGRPTGRSSIAERGGVELLLTAYCDALGEPLPAARSQHYVGVKWIYWRHDLQAAVVRWRRGELGPGGWLRSVWGPKIEAVGSVRDPVPFLADVAGAARVAARRAGRLLARRLRLAIPAARRPA
jgi:D-aspartate ligase